MEVMDVQEKNFRLFSEDGAVIFSSLRHEGRGAPPRTKEYEAKQAGYGEKSGENGNRSGK